MMQKQLMDAGWNLDNSYAKLPSVFYTKQSAQPVARPKLLVLNDALAASLGLNADLLKQEENVEIFAGNRNPVGSEPLAQAYAGHQFGHFNRLGDGRALLIGEQLTPAGERMDIQLKGSGVTPYSRAGDGRAAIGPMLREYIISEAMQALGVPTTRILAVVSTGETIYRETERPGAVLTRVAASHLRVGTFQYAAALGNVDDLRALADYAIQRHYAELAADDDRYLRLLENVIRRQAALIAKWQQIGFIHGVMNTDNMTISGETIDYGPCAFMDNYNPATVFSSIDTQGRYAYGNQPYIGGWNLARFAESLLPLLHTDEEQAVQMAQDAISSFSELYHHHWLAGMRTKLGLFNAEAADEELVKDLLDLMEKHQADYTNTFVALTFGQAVGHGLSDDAEFANWHARWQARLARQEQGPEAVREQMSKTNPAVIPRNHRVEEALERAEQHGDYSVMNKLLAVLKNPYAHSSEQAEYAAAPMACDPNYRTFCGT
ncbi:protein adenylyltransferase SelO [Paenibacillus hubeiensis]|uniref:protein adenylyltransferase SelO n=1 Tax=Paenibacillus hubeiensis TaxID=3077330 RepID=UPI0031BA4D5E